jgi:ABC-type bacteriocin/lantibiotic exporter with double-glycine peptidase domain
VVSDLENNKISPLRVLKKISVHLNIKRKKNLIFVFILSIFSSLAESISIVMLVPFISFFINPDLYLLNSFLKIILNFLNITNQKEILSFISFSFIFTVILSSFLRLTYIKFCNQLTENITSDFRIKIFNFLINQDFSYYFKHGTNEIMSNLVQKTGSFTAIIFSSISILNAILISTAIVTVLIINEPFYTPIIIFTIILFFFAIFKIKANSVLKKGQNINLNQNFIIDIFENTVGYLPEIIIYNLKNFFSVILNKTSKDTAKSSAEIRTIGMSPRIYLETFVIVFVVLFIYFSDFSERLIATNISYLAILAFGAQKCLPLINSIYYLSINFKASVPSVLGYLNILNKQKTNIEFESTYDPINFEKSIKTENLSFQYDKNLPNVLSNISLQINKGEKVLIKGETGSGKSTLANIISGLLDPSKGKIIIDDNEIKPSNKKGWQKNIAIVPQTVFLTDSTILENIAIAINLNEINIDKAKQSAKFAQIDDFIENLPNQYNEKVGERGVRLSGGQRQRIGIARALYRDANLIILDEPTNALDLETEKLVIDSITKISKDITIIMISHSNNSLKYFDKIIDLDTFK